MAPMRLLLLLLITLTSHSWAQVPVRYLYDLPVIDWQSLPRPEAKLQQPADSGGVMRLALTPFPAAVQRLSELPQHSDWLERLQMPLALQHQGGLHSGLLERWGQQQQRLYLQLNRQARWSDGVRLTSRDLVFTLQQHGPSNLIAIEVYSEQHVALQFSQLAPEHLSQLAPLRLLPAHYYEAFNASPDALRWQPEPTSGPYYIDSVQPGEALVLRRTPNWWAAEQFVGRFRIATIRLQQIDPNQQWPALVRGEIDWLQFRYLEDLSPLRQRARNYRMQIWQQPSTNPPFVILGAGHDKSSVLAQQLRSYFDGQASAAVEFHPPVTLLHPPGLLQPESQALADFLTGQGFQVRPRSAGLLEDSASNDIIISHVQNPDQLAQPHWSLPSQPNTLLVWNWLQLPDGAPSADPFDLHHGGYLYVDGRQRNAILSRPDRRRAQDVSIRTLNATRESQQ
ncbi:hypothetical protein GCM10011297_12200 [Bacterioplanes sanyensis]|uniref:ABC transporter substrate-binding protein n=1 Tax=Bacterioplanes sanyensis TaxID=1249553 RepID=UPI0016780EDF|nr:ABC transporter substrate-binding protein [Bacterioplanes sanyensis]GGY40791.1 hypothetical protein GCM10011297_12200 [Bacterioplanes sanyensis]